MQLEQVKGNTWVLKSWELIPLYRLDEHRCVLLDTGLYEQREELEESLTQAGLTVAGILGSHAHIDHMGSHAYFQKKGAKLALALGEAGQLFSYMGLQLQYYNLHVESFQRDYPELGTAPCLADRIILPQEDHITFCGAEFDVIHTPGHTADHLCIRTPDDVLYLGDAVMTGRTLHGSKFPYTFCMKEYLASLGKLRTEKAAKYVVAHQGVYDEILPLIDLELRFLTERMLELLDLFEAETTPKQLTRAICHTYKITSRSVRDLAYFELASQTYILYLCGQGYLEPVAEDDNILYRKTKKVAELKARKSGVTLPPTGKFSRNC
jgi:glyoxylase-like metal-dependent hydrolase (beta-lactamase superfamily II)